MGYLHAVAQSQAVQVVAEISEKISGAKRNQDREGIQQLLVLSRRGAIQEVLVSEVSRLGRSTVEVLHIVEELTQLGISIYVQNFGIETLKNGKRNPVAQFMFTLLAEFARLKRETARTHSLGHGRGAAARRHNWPAVGRDGSQSRLFEKVCGRRPAAARGLERT